jgi:hypothetical protein
VKSPFKDNQELSELTEPELLREMVRDSTLYENLLVVPEAIQNDDIVLKTIQEQEIVQDLEPIDLESEEEQEESIDSDLLLKIDEDQGRKGDTFVGFVPLLHLEYKFQCGDTFRVESKNKTNHEIIFVGSKATFSLLDPSNFGVINVGDVYKVVERLPDLKGGIHDYNITFNRIKEGNEVEEGE